ncbi:MAG TPA: hypothetical protein DEA50_16580, partial [Parvularcula sp.]|nr:hypothetical protein [Parvularcula sp.]
AFGGFAAKHVGPATALGGDASGAAARLGGGNVRFGIILVFGIGLRSAASTSGICRVGIGAGGFLFVDDFGEQAAK